MNFARLFNWLGRNNIATEVIKKVFPEAENICNNPDRVDFVIAGFTCILSKSGNGLKVDTTWYKKEIPYTFTEWAIHSKDYMIRNYVSYIKPYLELKKPTIHDKVRLYMKNRYSGEKWDYLIYISNYKSIKKATDKKFLNDLIKQVEDAYEQYLSQCEKKDKELNEQLIKFRLEVIPVLERFSKNIEIN